ncbi:YifB family Mg chelatase-like AAA ATPase [Simiduia agarivorans]|uniref:Mg chelatase-like protein n=1 Tax=Simiduia agarivorans (strain DSM 21679 / JCM 13881 / BCRC 17597 / SA1) TaxID=1117647 RepID=K4KNT9_SIMAS|nr:YifB family Mg chelatase-like AAA ATPase [Simiduia agarivorans]AFU99773.1 Mg chelatase-like protein [Simiduia agarivorans SA1 = DSM 21679]
MSLAIVHTRARVGIDAPLVSVEVHLSNGLPGLAIVGMPETAVRESKDRVRSALINSHFEFPARRITINLAPADLPKEGGRFDLPIAIGILVASGQLPAKALDTLEFVGELALSGDLRAVPGCLAAVMAAHKAGRTSVVPAGNGPEAALADTPTYVACNLLQVCACLQARSDWPRACGTAADTHPAPQAELADVRGQPLARRALEIAAAGNHNLLFYGPPGTGKTLLASRLTSILPPLTRDEALEVALIHSLVSSQPPLGQRPFRHPHHSASAPALVGGGSVPRPGEISLAHKGVLFLDELPEFPRSVLEVLREPLEHGEVRIARAQTTAVFPCEFQLVAALNPCPCGYAGENRCRCTPDQISRYRGRLSGPLLDRIDMHVPVRALDPAQLRGPSQEESSSVVAARVLQARQRAQARQGKANQYLSPGELEQHAHLTDAQHSLLGEATESLGLSVRAWHRILRVARTLADLDATDQLEDKHLCEALGYRTLDRRAG